MAFGWASDDPAKREVSESVLEERLKQVEGDLKYYTPAVHKASYALPKFLSN
jgi:spermidine synthase